MRNEIAPLRDTNSDGEPQSTPSILVHSTPGAAWLPPGSTAEVWAGPNCTDYEPAIIVRLLLTRGDEFFTVETEKGDDLPTLFLGRGDARISAQDGVEQLLHDVLGRSDVHTSCIGFVRNVVPSPDPSYPHPVPNSHVPVFLIEDECTPVIDGRWHTVESARPELSVRHWWPIVEAQLG